MKDKNDNNFKFSYHKSVLVIILLFKRKLLRALNRSLLSHKCKHK